MALTLEGVTGTLVDVPTRIPVQGGIFQAANVLSLPPHGSLGVHYQADGTTDAHIVDTDEQTCIDTAVSISNGFNFVNGNAFDVYAAVECNGFGNTIDDFAAEATSRLVAAEQRAIETYAWGLFAEKGVDVTTAPISAKRALGLLESVAGQLYTYVPTVHFGRQVAVDLADHFLIKFDGDKAAAVGGARAVNGAGYISQSGPGGVTLDQAGTDSAWMYITGQITVWQGPIFVKSAFEQTTNKLFAVATRSEVIAIDGNLVYAAQVELDK